MNDDIASSFGFPAVGRKKITAAFDGGRLTSDGGVLLLAQAERAMGICQRLAACIADPRDPARVIHRLDDILRARVFAIACGYEDADDLDALRDDPGFRLALGKLPESGAGLASQPTMSRWENAPTTRELASMMAAMIDIYCASYPAPPTAVTLDIDDTCDVVHGYQQLSFWNGHHGERCFLPIHIYDTATGRPVAMLLRTGKTPSGKEAAGHIRRLVRHILRHWPDTHITIRGDGHYGRPEVMAFCEAAGVDYVFGLPTNAALRADPAIVAVADACAVKRAQRQCPGPAQLCRDPLRRKELEVPAPRRRPDRGQHAGHGHPLCRHLVGTRIGRAHLRHALLRAWSGREPDQAPQDPARQRSHLVPLGQCQSDAPDPAHCRLLAAVAHPAGDAQDRCSGKPSLRPCACGCSRSLPAS
jgi:hypothetical protein